ncbi:MAG TPA: multiheme c-type cytochrome [Burkholderiales bacterium]|nr:multiheme c-type cytochrome [Burkholderiales bacterium]
MDRALAALLLVCALAPALAQPVLPHYSRDRSLGVASCASSLCHGSVEPWQNARVQQNEYVTWSRTDRHARAYDTLLTERSAEIARKLGLKAPAHQSDVCLDCHAHNPGPERRARGFVQSDGIGCEACHGPSERWIKSHVEPGATRRANIAHGMYPTGEPLARGRLCVSCHVGNTQKLVTHRMMAAGHPRLSFEIDTFSHLQPHHYARNGEDGAHLWAIGQVLAAEEQLDILLDPKRGRDGLFPELVVFDCHACHHAMSQKRAAGTRLGLAPGAVRLNDSSLLMVRHIARRVTPARAEALARDIAQLHTAIAGGDDALAQARRVRQSLQELVQATNAYRFSAADLRAVLFALIDDGLAGEYSDYQGAEQATMALQALADLMSRRGLLRAEALKPAMSQLLAAVANDEDYHPTKYTQALRELRAGIERQKAR